MSRPTSIDLRSRAASAAAGVPDIPSGDIATPALRSILQSLAKRESGSTETVRVVERAAGGSTDASTAYLLSRENHTGTQSPATIEGLEALIRAIAQQVVLENLLTVQYVDADATLTAVGIVIIDASAGDIVLNLASGVGTSPRMYYLIRRDVSANTVTLVPDGIETIMEYADAELLPQDSLTLFYYDDRWVVV